MADLRIVDAPEIPTNSITGQEKLPTGGSGNYSITLDSVADYTKTKKDLADNASVNNKVNGVRQELDAHIEDLLNPHQVTKGQIGLGNVDNTADLDKPVSNSTQAAIISATTPKADKTYVDNSLLSKSDKTYVDSQLTLKADKADVYTKSETYTKQENNDLVNNSISTALIPVNTSLDLAKRGIANRYDSSLTYNSGERVVLTNGDIVKSTVNGNTNNPNVNMTGWVKLNDATQLEYSPLKNKITRTVDDKLYESLSVKDFGAIGDGTLHTVNEWTVVGSKIYYPNLAAIQVDYPHVTALTDSVDWAAAQKAINTTNIAYYPKSTGAYINNKTLQLNGNWDTVIGASKQVVVKNIGAGLPALRLTKAYQTVRNIAIWGDGGLNGVGATTGHGIYLDNGVATNFHDVSIRYHGGHGIYGNNGVWITKVNQCYIENNLQDGINLVSPSGGAFEQNGNALSITDSSIAGNGGNGVKWKAVALSISGSVLEANKGYGLLVSTLGYIESALGISVVGNYTENNILGELKFESTASAIVSDVNITGNYFYSIQTGGAIAAITFVGTYRSTRNVNIRSNGLAKGGTVLNLVDGGNSFREDCTVDAGAYSVVNMTQCQLIQGNKTKSISGAFLSKGVTWTNPSGPSANFFSATATDIYFPIDLQQAQALLDIKFYITANMTATYSIAARLMSKDSSTGGAPVIEYNTTLTSGGSGGNSLFTIAPVQSNQPIRIAANKSYYLHLTVSPPSTGSSIQIHDPILRFV